MENFCMRVRAWAFVLLRDMRDIYYLGFLKLSAIYSDTLTFRNRASYI